MATITKELSVDVAQLNRFSAIVAKQYDKQSRFLKVTLQNQGQDIIVDSASTVVINARREDDASKTFAGTVNNDGTVTVPLTYWMLELDGVVECDISIITGDTTVLTTTLFDLEVQEAAAPDDSDISGDDDYGVLIKLIADVQAIKDAEATRVTAETARVEAETARATAETARAEAETARATSEKNRTSAESSRVSAEKSRVSAEKARATAEEARVKAETARETAEQTRVTETSQAILDCNEATAKAQAAADNLVITNSDTGKSYKCSIKVSGGKPYLVYEEITTETE